MKIKTKIKLTKLKDKLFNILNIGLCIIVYPVYLLATKIDSISHYNKEDIKHYKDEKLRKLLYSKIQDRIINEGELYILDVDYIDEYDERYDMIKIENLFNKCYASEKKYKILDDYYYYGIEPKYRQSMINGYWWDVVKNFDNDEISVKVINKEQLRELNQDWEHIKYSSVYRRTQRILYITKK